MLPRTLILLFAFLLMFFFGCVEAKRKDGDEEHRKKGFDLAKNYCGSCHSFVPAETLNRSTWKEHVLPDMAQKMGIKVLWGKEYVNSDSSGAAVSFKEWNSIVDYYTKTAPEKIELPLPVVPLKDSTLFKPHKAGREFGTEVRTVLTAFDTVTGSLFTGDGTTNRVYQWNSQLELVDSVQVNSPPTNILFLGEGKKRKAIITTMGTMHAREIRNGKVLQFNIHNKLTGPIDTFATALPRPVQSLQADFNKDGRTDILVCGFGMTTGELFWLKQLANGKHEKKNISSLPGATQAIVDDFNNDGLDDIMALFAYSLESLRLFINNGNEGFDETVLISFPPVYGSSSFQLVDFNGDSLSDILYTCGDNADVSQIIKPFHGVYIYLNRGNNKYEQEFFYHINGCTKAIARDFDQDGDADIATIAFYADHRNNPAETFILLRQDSLLKFQALSPKIDNCGRWLTMDAADYDKDGDVDILLGNFSKDLLIDKDFIPHWNLYLPFILLENKLR